MAAGDIGPRETSPSSAMRSATAGSRIAAWHTASTRAAASAGRPAGAASRNQLVTTAPGKPASARVGTSGNRGTRAAEVKPSARNDLCRTDAACAPIVSQIETVSPESTADCASGAPRNGTCSNFTPAACSNTSPARWPMEPAPELPELTVSGRARAAAA